MMLACILPCTSSPDLHIPKISWRLALSSLSLEKRQCGVTSMGCRKNLKSGVECLMVHTKKHILRFEVKQDLKLSQVFISDVHVSLHFIVGDPSAERGKTNWMHPFEIVQRFGSGKAVKTLRPALYHAELPCFAGFGVKTGLMTWHFLQTQIETEHTLSWYQRGRR